MSFTTDVKNELCKAPVHPGCCAVAECFGMLLLAYRFSCEEIRIQSDGVAVRKRARALFRAAFDIELHQDPVRENLLSLTDASALRRIFAAFGYEFKNTGLLLNRAVIEEECCKSAFLRGAFLVGGYASATEKGYHLELVTSHYNISRQILSLLLDMDMAAGAVERRGTHVIYFKDSDLIERFLTTTGATGSAMTLMLHKVEKDLRNRVNRKVNCETANLDKTIEASAKQVEAINILLERGLFETLPQSLKETADIRLQHPEESLSELLQYFSPPITKPGLNNRMRKLLKLAED